MPTHGFDAVVALDRIARIGVFTAESTGRGQIGYRVLVYRD